MLPSHMLVCSLPLCANRLRPPAPFPSFCISHTNSSPWRLPFFLECAVEHRMKDASPACPVPDGEGVSRPKDLNVHVSLLECAVAKMPSRKSFRMRSYKKRGGGGYLSRLLHSNFQTFRRASLALPLQ